MLQKANFRFWNAASGPEGALWLTPRRDFGFKVFCLSY
ncbi:hypothetical protein D1AOALGA4SA_9090 [Olavius algarvensis Delta 1 endosymbiont]|nr:hypothetical protein D1AOALGA4SA_9090 [Olavius algarvensis Delta 1 endosymbiont]